MEIVGIGIACICFIAYPWVMIKKKLFEYCIDNYTTTLWRGQRGLLVNMQEIVAYLLFYKLFQIKWKSKHNYHIIIIH